MEEQMKRLMSMMEQQQVQIKLQMEQQSRQMETIAALSHENAELRSGQSTSGISASRKTRCPDRPMIDSGMNDSEWEVWLDSWKRYKSMTKIGELDMVNELRSCCSTEVNTLLFQYIGPDTLNSTSETSLLEHIKSVAVKGLHIEVHRKNFGSLYQQDGESITRFVARLRSQAGLCDFFVSCSCDEPRNVSFAEQMVSHQLIIGIRNQDHQAKILAEAPSLVTLEDKIKRLQALETTEDSAIQLKPTNLKTDSSTTSAAATKGSSYKRVKGRQHEKPNQTNEKDKEKKCRWCGRKNHPGKTMQRKDCPAFNKICSNCGIKGHFTEVCQRSRSNQIKTNQAQTDASDESESELSASFAFGVAIEAGPNKVESETSQ